jgi:fumarate hydratase class II
LGLEVNVDRVNQLLQASLMLVTALTPHIGYDRAAKIALRAQQQGCSLREAALALGFVSAEQFDVWVDPRLMLGPRRSP